MPQAPEPRGGRCPHPAATAPRSARLVPSPRGAAGFTKFRVFHPKTGSSGRSPAGSPPARGAATSGCPHPGPGSPEPPAAGGRRRLRGARIPPRRRRPGNGVRRPPRGGRGGPGTTFGKLRRWATAGRESGRGGCFLPLARPSSPPFPFLCLPSPPPSPPRGYFGSSCGGGRSLKPTLPPSFPARRRRRRPLMELRPGRERRC